MTPSHTPTGGLTAAFAAHPVAANLLVLLIILVGFNGLSQLTSQTFPDFEPDAITITITWPGSGPGEVEESLVNPVEEAMVAVEGVRTITASASERQAVISLELMDGAHLGDTLDDVRNELETVTLPEAAEVQVTSAEGGKDTVVRLALYGPVGELALRQLAQEVRDELAHRGVTRVTLASLREREVHVVIPQATLRGLGLTWSQVAERIAGSSLNLAAGTLRHPSSEALLRYHAQGYRAADFAAIPLISRADGATVRLGQVAELRDTFEEVDISGRFQGQPAVLLVVFRAAGEDALAISGQVSAYLAEKNPHLPPGVGLEEWGSMARVVESRLDLLERNALSGFVLVTGILLLFLNARTAFWVAAGIPISFLGAFAVMGLRGDSLNMVNMFGLILALGIVVDDGIVVGENIVRHRERGDPPLTAALKGLREVMVPVTCATLTTVAAFLPLLAMPGRIGKLIVAVPMVLVTVLLVSLVEVFLALPAHLRHAMEREGSIPAEPGPVNRWLDRFARERYLPTLEWALHHRVVTFGGALALLLLSIGLVLGGRVPFTFFPAPESDFLSARVVFPVGTPAETTRRTVAGLERTIQAISREAAPLQPDGQPLVARLYTAMGSSALSMGSPERGGHVAEVMAELLPSEVRTLSAQAVVDAWRERYTPPPGLESLTITQLRHRPAGRDVEVRLYGDDPHVLKQAATLLRESLARFPGVNAIEDDLPPGKREVHMVLTPTGEALGLTGRQLAEQVRGAYYGAVAQTFQDGRDEVTVRVLPPEAERRSLGTLETLMVRTPGGTEVPLGEVARLSVERGFSRISHADRQLAVTVTADVDPERGNDTLVLAHIQRELLPDLAQRFGVRGGMAGQMEERELMRRNMVQGGLTALTLIYVILAWVFRSYLRPLVVMAAIPLGLIGAILGHWVLGFNLTILSVIGILGLAGVVVNDGIVLLDFARHHMESGHSPREAIMAAGRLRLRAVLLTSATTIAGLLPLLLERSMQARFLIPMAISIAFGLMFATVLVLILIPCLFVILEEDVRARS